MTLLAPIETKTLLDRARWLYRERAADTAVVLVDHDGEKTIMYGEFLEHAARFAHALEAEGVQPGDLVVLVLQHGEDVLYGFWGAMLLGAIPSIFPFLTEKLNPDRYFANVRRLVELSEVKVVITYSDLEEQLQSALTGVQTLGGILNMDQMTPGGDINAFLARNPAQGDDTAFLQHSSGSTGLQKGVMLSHRSVLNQINSYSAAIKLQDSDVVVSWLPLYHDMGLIAGFIIPIMQGVPLVLMSPFHWIRDPKVLLQAIQRHKGTLCWLPNFAYNFMAMRIRDKDLEGLDLSGVRAFINCSEPVYAESHKVFTNKYVPYGLKPEVLSTCYAMAENTFAVTQSSLDEPLIDDVVDRIALMEQKQALPSNGTGPAMTLVSCGYPIPECELKIVDAERNVLSERYVGEIALRSDSMLTGYYHREDATDAVMEDGWYFTGDMGYSAGGQLYITGRKKDLVIIGGKNIYPQDIENLLNDIDGIHPGRTVAFGVPNDRLGTEDLAIIAEVDVIDDPEARGDIMREVRSRVVQNTDVVARYVHLVERMWLAKTSSGKIARAANRERFLNDVMKR